MRAGSRTLEKAIVQGTTRMRTHVEVDPRVGLRSFHAIRRLKRDYAWAIDLEICVFPQEGLLNDPGTEELLVAGLRGGGRPDRRLPLYRHAIRRTRLRVSLPSLGASIWTSIFISTSISIPLGCISMKSAVRRSDIGGAGALPSATSPSCRRSTVKRSPLSRADSPTRVSRSLCCPATDLFLMGRDHDHSIPRGVAPAHQLVQHGVTCSLATNNVLNPFTPFGDCSLIRMANLYANVAGLGRAEDFADCLSMVSTMAAKLMNLRDYGIVAGGTADLLVLDCSSAAAAVTELSQPLFALKKGRRSFTRAPADIHR